MSNCPPPDPVRYPSVRATQSPPCQPHDTGVSAQVPQHASEQVAPTAVLVSGSGVYVLGPGRVLANHPNAPRQYTLHSHSIFHLCVTGRGTLERFPLSNTDGQAAGWSLESFTDPRFIVESRDGKGRAHVAIHNLTKETTYSSAKYIGLFPSYIPARFLTQDNVLGEFLPHTVTLPSQNECMKPEEMNDEHTLARLLSRLVSMQIQWTREVASGSSNPVWVTQALRRMLSITALCRLRQNGSEDAEAWYAELQLCYMS
ncbi:hypothetical protein C2E23DRAFT_473420 [Lenzites betulinus]|nr:hypothetical protein C2E23DRAFT_473420 [Lenzites betulinus]